MSKTIEERANEFLDLIREDYVNQCVASANTMAEDTLKAVYNVYIQGAQKQRAIDYAKACNAFCKFHCGEKKGCMCEDLCKFSTLFTEDEE